jgi:hypothetical protein
MTLDDVGCLRSHFRGENELAHETQLTAKPRQNVIFEAGMAMALRPDKTVLVELGEIQTHTISDLAGLHTIRMNNSIEKRKMLLGSLETSGCRVDKSGKEWTDKEKGGDFDAAIESSRHDDSEIEQLLQDELRRLEAKVAKPLRVLEQPRSIREETPRLHREAPRVHLEAPRPIREAIQIAMEEVNRQVVAIGWGSLEYANEIDTIQGGVNIVLVERKGATTDRRRIQFRVRVRDSKAYVLRLTEL